MRVGLALVALSAATWSRQIAAAGHCPHMGAIAAPPPPADVWLIEVRPRMPAGFGFWLRTLPAPVALLTKQLAIGAVHAQYAPRVRVVCHPAAARAVFADVIAILCSGTSGAPVVLRRPGGAHG